MNVEKLLDDIRKQVNACEQCALHFSRKNAVPGEGPIDAKIMFIGEGPGFHENQEGHPFVGAAGKFFEELLQKASLTRQEVFVTNVVKCRPPGNRDPVKEEITACSQYLDRQIELINPSVIVTLGRFSMGKYFKNEKISQIHGQAKIMNGRTIIAMYHPAAALHQQSLRSTIIKDFEQLPGIFQNEIEGKTNNANDYGDLAADDEERKIDIKPKQLSLF